MIPDCIIQFSSPDDEHMCSKHVEAWNKLIIKFSDDTRDCIIQFSSPDDEHMCSKHVQAWNKLIIKFSDDTRDCIIEFSSPDDEHMCSKHVEAWNKLIIKFSASSWLILRNKLPLCVQRAKLPVSYLLSHKINTHKPEQLIFYSNQVTGWVSDQSRFDSRQGQNVHIGTGTHPVLYVIGTEDYFLGGKAARAWSRPFTSN